MRIFHRLKASAIKEARKGRSYVKRATREEALSRLEDARLIARRCDGFEIEMSPYMRALLRTDLTQKPDHNGCIEVPGVPDDE